MALLAAVAVYVVTFFIIGSSLLVAAQFFLRWRATVRGSRLLPLHVWTLALSYDALLVMGVAYWPHAPTWVACLYVPTLLLGVAAMVAMLRHQREARTHG